jgi:outer membrane protein TolC
MRDLKKRPWYTFADMRNMTGTAALLCLLAASGPLGAQDKASPPPSLPVLNLDSVLSAATAAGDDFGLVTDALEVARKQRDLDLARQGFSLSASGGYGLVDGIGDDGNSAGQSLISGAVSASGGSASNKMNGLAQSPQGSLTLLGPQTKATLSVTHSIPVAPNLATNPQASVLGLTLSQTLWDGYPGGQYQATLAQSLLALQISEFSAIQGRSAAITKVKQSYIAMLAAQRDLDIKGKVLDKQRSLLAQIQAIFNLKQATAIDLKTAQVNVRSAEIDVSTADKTLRLANERLAVIMGRARDERFAVAELADSPLPAASIDEAIAIGLRKRTDVAQLELRSRSSRIGAAVARAQGQPNLAVTGGLGTAVAWSTTPLMAGALSLGAKVALPVFDSGAADFLARTSEGQAQLFGLQASQLRKSLSSDIRDFFEGAMLQSDRVVLAKDSMDLADAQFELVKAQNQYGTATVQDVLTASVNAATAEVAYQSARSAYLGAVLQLSTAMGL